MRINEIIKKKRLEKGLTQEQVAQYLGVTAPAVNKWEKGVSYPEITLLPVLARLLGTDLNTLLCFQEDLTREEVGEIINHISGLSKENGFGEAYSYGMEKVAEYPNSHHLLLNVGLVLEGILLMTGERSEYSKEKAEIEKLYRRAAESSEEAVANQAKAMLISMYQGREEYEKAQELIDTLPDKNPLDKEQIQINLWTAQGNYEEAGKRAERNMMKLISDTYGTLLTLMELAIKEERIENAKRIAELYKKTAMQFDMWEYGWYVGDVELYSSLKDWDKFIETIELMFRALKKEWSPSGSAIFHYMDFSKQQEKSGDKKMGSMMREMILNGIYSDEETAFLKDDSRFQEMLERVGE